jgi:glycosyl transferase family 25
MVQQFLRAGLDVTFLPAIDGTNSAIAEEAARISVGSYGRRIGAGAYACFQSHRMIWKYLIAGDDSHALIFEDDMILSGNLSALLKNDWIPHDADIVKLEARLVRVQLGRKQYMPVGCRSLHRLHSSHFGTGCYVISRSAAERLLEQTERPADAIDELIFDDRSDIFRSLMIYQMVPAPTIQGDRMGGEEMESDWKKTSIESRFGDGFSPEGDEKTFFEKVGRRVRAEINALLNGWKYRYVDFG